MIYSMDRDRRKQAGGISLDAELDAYLSRVGSDGSGNASGSLLRSAADGTGKIGAVTIGVKERQVDHGKSSGITSDSGSGASSRRVNEPSKNRLMAGRHSEGGSDRDGMKKERLGNMRRSVSPGHTYRFTDKISYGSRSGGKNRERSDGGSQRLVREGVRGKDWDRPKATDRHQGSGGLDYEGIGSGSSGTGRIRSVSSERPRSYRDDGYERSTASRYDSNGYARRYYSRSRSRHRSPRRPRDRDERRVYDCGSKRSRTRSLGRPGRQDGCRSRSRGHNRRSLSRSRSLGRRARRDRHGSRSRSRYRKEGRRDYGSSGYGYDGTYYGGGTRSRSPGSRDVRGRSSTRRSDGRGNHPTRSLSRDGYRRRNGGRSRYSSPIDHHRGRDYDRSPSRTGRGSNPPFDTRPPPSSRPTPPTTTTAHGSSYNLSEGRDEIASTKESTGREDIEVRLPTVESLQIELVGVNEFIAKFGGSVVAVSGKQESVEGTEDLGHLERVQSAIVQARAVLNSLAIEKLKFGALEDGFKVDRTKPCRCKLPATPGPVPGYPYHQDIEHDHTTNALPKLTNRVQTGGGSGNIKVALDMVSVLMEQAGSDGEVTIQIYRVLMMRISLTKLSEHQYGLGSKTLPRHLLHRLRKDLGGFRDYYVEALGSLDLPRKVLAHVMDSLGSSSAYAFSALPAASTVDGDVEAWPPASPDAAEIRSFVCEPGFVAPPASAGHDAIARVLTCIQLREFVTDLNQKVFNGRADPVRVEQGFIWALV